MVPSFFISIVQEETIMDNIFWAHFYCSPGYLTLHYEMSISNSKKKKKKWDFSRYGLWYHLHILSSLAQIPRHKVYIKCCLSGGLNKQMNEGRTKWVFPKLKRINLYITVIITLIFQKFMHTFLSSGSRYCQYFTSFLELTTLNSSSPLVLISL